MARTTSVGKGVMHAPCRAAFALKAQGEAHTWPKHNILVSEISLKDVSRMRCVVSNNLRCTLKKPRCGKKPVAATLVKCICEGRFQLNFLKTLP